MRQFRSNQGRSPKKEKETMKVIAVAAVGFVVVIVISLLIDSVLGIW